ncbi:MAG: DegT/DnrJ/EryC1/StrS family aminotransferase [Mucilaginibacter sp.]
MHLQPVFQNYPSYINNVSEQLFNNGLCLPSGSNLKEEDLKRVVDNIKQHY